jgi:hypothetical protein
MYVLLFSLQSYSLASLCPTPDDRSRGNRKGQGRECTLQDLEREEFLRNTIHLRAVATMGQIKEMIGRK